MTDLLTRLESGAGSDRELDALILCKLAAPEGSYVQQSRFNGEWCVYEKDRPGRPQRTWEDAKWGRQSQWAYTSSLDAALSLVERMLPKCGVNIDIAPDGQETVCAHIQQSEAEWTYHGWPAEFAKTAPRAVLKALLRTLETREKDKREPQT